MCRYDPDGCDYPTFITTTNPVARKRHRCDECRRIIEPGERYESTFGVWEGEASSHKVCEHCQSAVSWLYKECGGSLYGEVFEDLRDHLQEGYIEVGRVLVGMKRHWKTKAGERMKVPEWRPNPATKSGMSAKVA